ncbi:hypothetical protein DKAM_0694 [Desulfurococcus amylolyticus 1221n]|uniref:Uncharacterized protein n=2 Tax=Desulfurococcus amylolyticus TaxID=94694 RepID=B8D4I9_DESA1|nr:hypothetical protein DKAM_0694 [Desulfurococcus amylolyticus 1221n]
MTMLHQVQEHIKEDLYATGFTTLNYVLEYFELELVASIRDKSLSDVLSLLNDLGNKYNSILASKLLVEGEVRCVIVYREPYLNIQCSKPQPGLDSKVIEADIYMLSPTPSIKDIYPATVMNTPLKCINQLYLASLFFSKEHAVKGLECIGQAVKDIEKKLLEKQAFVNKKNEKISKLILDKLSKTLKDLGIKIEAEDWVKVLWLANELVMLYSETKA